MYPESASLKPTSPEIGVVALVPDNWDDHWQVRHHILLRLANHFRTVWVEPARDWRTDIRQPSFGGFHQPRGSLTVYEPAFWLPKLYHPNWAASLTAKARVQATKSWLRRSGCQSITLYLWRPELAAHLCLRDFDLICYHIDDEYSFSDTEVQTSPEEEALIRAADQVFIHSPGLMEKKGGINPHTAFVPLGVDFRAFSTPQLSPPDIERIPRPRIGYAGSIKKQLDWRLLDELIALHPEWSFVFIGAVLNHRELPDIIARLSANSNVHFLPPKQAETIPAYVQQFDVGLLPYKLDDYSRYGYPLKLHEYLAAGIPVIGTRMRTLEDFAEYAALPVGVAGWSEAIGDALQPAMKTAELRAFRQRKAAEHDWDGIVTRIACSMKERLQTKLLR